MFVLYMTIMFEFSAMLSLILLRFRTIDSSSILVKMFDSIEGGRKNISLIFEFRFGCSFTFSRKFKILDTSSSTEISLLSIIGKTFSRILFPLCLVLMCQFQMLFL